MLYWDTVSPALRELLLSIARNPAFSSFRLCGGTALALQLNHRISIDADYVAETWFDKEEFAALVAREIPKVTNIYVGEIGVFMEVNGIKLVFFHGISHLSNLLYNRTKYNWQMWKRLQQ